MKLQTEKRTEERFSTLHKKTVERKGCESNKLTFLLQTVRIKRNKTWKKAFRSELLELCRTGTKKSSPDMFNFDVFLADPDMATDADHVPAQIQIPMVTNKKYKK